MPKKKKKKKEIKIESQVYWENVTGARAGELNMCHSVSRCALLRRTAGDFAWEILYLSVTHVITEAEQTECLTYIYGWNFWSPTSPLCSLIPVNFELYLWAL